MKQFALFLVLICAVFLSSRSAISGLNLQRENVIEGEQIKERLNNIIQKNVVDSQICKDQSSKMLFARSGCCSWHQGVCGCDDSSDRIICCDGTLSPSCTCSGY
ncbi:MAG: hypothetical protein COV43_08995 [Deltaproteobacteria bacterium CG11_big_fil_rev_8_21_14_0_20_42_23]|nr:MAG: hypothetical protein COV43_08995 [Deltaproteobacteria bacterium CG11_big_fil_rev_8_21_14_0_20_42_23]PJC63414.1 MAG: hypothetical protein CO021_09605 [Deltaproteobacteria bacterium CG_4_9_14_0_2_um_filter_42_21]